MERKIVKIDFQGMKYEDLLKQNTRLNYRVVNAENLSLSEALGILLYVLDLYKTDNNVFHMARAIEKAYFLSIISKEKRG